MDGRHGNGDADGDLLHGTVTKARTDYSSRPRFTEHVLANCDTSIERADEESRCVLRLV